MLFNVHSIPFSKTPLSEKVINLLRKMQLNATENVPVEQGRTRTKLPIFESGVPDDTENDWKTNIESMLATKGRTQSSADEQMEELLNQEEETEEEIKSSDNNDSTTKHLVTSTHQENVGSVESSDGSPFGNLEKDYDPIDTLANEIQEHRSIATHSNTKSGGGDVSESDKNNIVSKPEETQVIFIFLLNVHIICCI